MGPPNPRKGATEPDILNIEPGDFGVFEKVFTDSMGVSGRGGRFLGFGNEFYYFGGGKLALLCNRRMNFGGGDGAGGGFDEAVGVAWGGGGVEMGIHVRIHIA